jgi:hypothetical protein
MTEMEEFLRDDEPFMIRQRTAEELADYDAGFKASKDGKEWMRHRALHGSVVGESRKNNYLRTPCSGFVSPSIRKA